MSNSPLVSAIIPTYNGEEFITDAIESVLNQTYENFELIVVDDGSEDQTVDLVKSYDDSRITIYQNNENMGIAGNMNRGAALASGDILAFLDQDDYWSESKIEQHVKSHATESAEVVYSDIAVVASDGSHLERVNPPEPATPGEQLVRQLYVHLNFIRTFSSVTISREAWRDVGGLDESLTVSADYDLYLRLAELYKFEHIASPLATKRRHGENASGNYRALYTDVQRISERIQRRHPSITNLNCEERAEHYFQWAFRAYRADETREALRYCLKSVTSGVRPTSTLLLLILILDTLTGYLQIGTHGYRLYLYLKKRLRSTL